MAQQLAMTVLLVPSSLAISSPPSTTVTVPVPDTLRVWSDVESVGAGDWARAGAMVVAPASVGVTLSTRGGG